MSEDKKELLEIYQKLDMENKENVLAYLRVALAAQENTRKAINKPSKKQKTA